jgi:hypothetical protein
MTDNVIMIALKLENPAKRRFFLFSLFQPPSIVPFIALTFFPWSFSSFGLCPLSFCCRAFFFPLQKTEAYKFTHTHTHQEQHTNQPTNQQQQLLRLLRLLLVFSTRNNQSLDTFASPEKDTTNKRQDDAPSWQSISSSSPLSHTSITPHCPTNKLLLLLQHRFDMLDTDTTSLSLQQQQQQPSLTHGKNTPATAATAATKPSLLGTPTTFMTTPRPPSAMTTTTTTASSSGVLTLVQSGSRTTCLSPEPNKGATADPDHDAIWVMN